MLHLNAGEKELLCTELSSLKTRSYSLLCLRLEVDVLT